jgi:hypothetical protein
VGSNFVSISQYITHPISLVAYACALLTTYFIYRDREERKKLKANPAAYVETFKYLNVGLPDLPEEKRYMMAIRILHHRIIIKIISAITMLIGGCIFSYLVITLTKETTQPAPNHIVDTNTHRTDTLLRTVASSESDKKTQVRTKVPGNSLISASMTGQVKDSVGVGLADVEIRIAGSLRGRTDYNGFFKIDAIPPDPDNVKLEFTWKGRTRSDYWGKNQKDKPFVFH